MHTFADPKQVILAWSVYFPDFEVVEGDVVLGPLTPQQKEELTAIPADERTPEVLSSFRWCEVPYQFSDRGSTNAAHDHHMAMLMANSWLLQLENQFPHQSWRTHVLSPEQTGSVVGVGFENT